MSYRKIEYCIYEHVFALFYNLIMKLNKTLYYRFTFILLYYILYSFYKSLNLICRHTTVDTINTPIPWCYLINPFHNLILIITEFLAIKTVTILLDERWEAMHANLVHHSKSLFLHLTHLNSLWLWMSHEKLLNLEMTYCDSLWLGMTHTDSPGLFIMDYESYWVTSLVIHPNMVWWDINKTKPCRVYKPRAEVRLIDNQFRSLITTARKLSEKALCRFYNRVYSLI